VRRVSVDTCQAFGNAIEAVTGLSASGHAAGQGVVLAHWSTHVTGCLPACLPACLLACLPACLPAWLAGWLTGLLSPLHGTEPSLLLDHTTKCNLYTSS
jgi:hypothetical protein